MKTSHATVAGIVGFIACGLSCNQIAGIREGTLSEGTLRQCTEVEECTADAAEAPECYIAVACEEGRCIFADAIDGTPLAKQTPGDCVEVVCDNKFGTRLVQVLTDTEDDDNVCTLDACDGSTPTHTYQQGLPCYGGPPFTEGVGKCKAGIQTCDAEGHPVGSCEGEVLPATESCIVLGDEDCDGQVNEDGPGCTCIPMATSPCYTGPTGSEDVGACHAGMHSCTADGLGFGPCLGEQTPAIETCDASGIDEDCDGAVNEEGCVCGDGAVSGGETCDDGGTSDGDACSPTCQAQEVLRATAGSAHSCAVLTGGVVKCWGANGLGQLGLGDPEARGKTPGEMGNNLPEVDLGAGMTAVDVSAGHEHTCALLSGGHVKCWGNNAKGQLGLGDALVRGDKSGQMGDKLPVVDLGTNKTALSISAGYEHTCALLDDHSVKCWGANVGQLGLGDALVRGDKSGQMGDALPAVNLGKDKTAFAVVTGINHTCALLNDYSVKCWGVNGSGQLGQGDNKDRGAQAGQMGDNLLAVNLGTDRTATEISARGFYTCALLNDASVKCWGLNLAGQLGLGDDLSRGTGSNDMGDNLPAVNLGTGKTAIAISAGMGHACVILNDYDVKCWGYGAFGQLGLGNIENRGTGSNDMGDNLPAVSLGTGKTAVRITTGAVHVCAVLDDASVKCWGANSAYQLGLGELGNRGDQANEMGDNLSAVKLFSALW